MAPPKDVLALADELTSAKADWQLHTYGHAKHAFRGPRQFFLASPRRLRLIGRRS